MFGRFRTRKTFRFVLISGLLTGSAILAALVSAVAERIGEHDLATFSSKAALLLALAIIIYVIPRLARSMRFEYLYSAYSLNVPNSGLVFLALILLVTVLALSSGNNLLYLVLAVLLATMIISLIVSRLNLARLDVSIRYPDHIFAGESALFEVIITNRKKLMPTFSMMVGLLENRAWEYGSKTAGLAYFPIIPIRTKSRSRMVRKFETRGRYPVNGIILMSGFPLGFIEHRRVVEMDSEYFVYPRPLALDNFKEANFITQGRIESHIKGSGSDLYAIRQYLTSDHHHHIDWKATAKTTQLMVREFTRDDDWKITIAFDQCADDTLIESERFQDSFERAVIFAASLINYFINDGAEVRLLTLENDSGYGMGRMHCYSMLRQLAPIYPTSDKVLFESDEGENVIESELPVSVPGQEQMIIYISSGGLRGKRLGMPGSVHDIAIEDL